MAVGTLIKHGTNKGYRTEIATGAPCERCRNAHRVFDTQYSAAGKRKGLKYSSDEVIDHLYKAGRKPNISGLKSNPRQTTPNIDLSDWGETPAAPGVEAPSGQDQTIPDQSIGDRLADRIRAFVTPGDESNPYVEENDTGYVHRIDDIDESPGPEWQPVTDEQFIINAQGLKTIEQNLGTYLSVVGITVEMIDPYCGPILAQNFDTIVSRWSKVIAHYPKAAQLFLDGKGGVVFTWIGALQATWPVLYAIYQHHLAKTITVAPNGQIFHKNDKPNPENNGRFDPLQPEFQYSAT